MLRDQFYRDGKGPMTDLPATLPAPALDETQLANLAWEMARGLRYPEDILKKFGVSKEQFDAYIDTNPFYKRVLESAIIEWASTGNTKSRIIHKAGLALEENIVQLAKRMSDDEEDLGKVTEVAKLFSKIVGVDTVERQGGAGEKFTITINLGSDEKFTKTIEGTRVSEEVQSDASGEGDPA